MFHRSRTVLLSLALASLLFVATTQPRSAAAGVSDTVLALAGPLAQQFGVPTDSIASLLKSGVSLESATQLLLVAQSAKAKFGEVTSLFDGYGNDVVKTAKQLGVDASAYSEEKVSAAIDQAKATATAEASKKATQGASKALDSAFGGYGD